MSGAAPPAQAPGCALGPAEELAQACGHLSSQKGSGFLIADGRILTNHHVLRSEAEVAGTEVDFDYEQDECGRDTMGPCYRLDPNSW